jgi:thiol-disulfide isomerase/thioredoxin
MLVLAAASPAVAAESVDDIVPPESNWYAVDDEGEVTIDLWFFWSPTCPHCLRAEPWIEDIAESTPWLRLHSLPLTEDENIEQAIALREEISADQWQGAVPAFFACEAYDVGFDAVETTGAVLEQRWRACHDSLQARVDAASSGGAAPTTTGAPPSDGAATDKNSVTLPIIGEVSAESVSLPVFTVAIAAVDAFNPCAFFVLLALLSVLVHAGSRMRMAVIGGVFVLVSGVAYFVFMAGLLTLFGVIENQRIITVIGGTVALVIAGFAIKDFFWSEQGPSLSIPEGAKPGLFRRMRSLTQSASTGTMLFGAVTLALVANMYELLCTAGFPTVYNSVLLNADLTDVQRYLYLVFYNVVYVVPLVAIVGVFVWTLGSRKLSEREGRILKLLSGTMMLFLGATLLIRPAVLNNAAVGLMVLAAAGLVTWIVVVVDRRHRLAASPRVERAAPKRR